jgi:hypothetical protein
MLGKLVWGLRWATGVAIGFTAATWIVAVAFALVGFKRTAETINAAVLYALPIDATILALLVIGIIESWLTGDGKEPTPK